MTPTPKEALRGGCTVTDHPDRVEVAVGGHIDRKDRCPRCGAGMLFRTEVMAGPPDGTWPTEGRVVSSKFCGVYGCPAWLMEVAID